MDDPLLATFAPLTPSQRSLGKYFLVVAAVLLAQIAVGAIMAHACYCFCSRTWGSPSI
jgi:nitric oxide reductase subunit B